LALASALLSMHRSCKITTKKLQGNTRIRTEIDGPGPLAAISEEERADLFAPYGDMVTKNEVRILRYRADLSYASADE